MKLKLLWSSLLPVLFCSCSTLPIAMIPHSSHSETDYYWNSGKAVMVSSADSTYVALSAESLSNEVHATVYVRNASSSSFIIDTKNVRVTAVMGNGNAIDAELPCMSPGVELRADGDGKRPTVKYGVAVWTAKEYLKKTENQHIRSNILAAVSTGLASSGPLAQAFLVEDDISKSLVLDGIITLIDSKHIWNNLNEQEVTWEQIAFANVILLNKVDLVSKNELRDLEKKVRQINPTATIFHTSHAKIELDQILNIGGFNLKNVLDEKTFIPHHHESEQGISSVSLNFPGFIDPNRLNHWLQMLFLTEGMNIFRGKGILNVKNSTNRYIFQSVYMMFEGRFDRAWGNDTPENKMVFIGQDLDASRLEKSLKNSIQK